MTGDIQGTGEGSLTAYMLLLTALVLGCGGRSDHLGDSGNDVPHCVPGSQIACACAGRPEGVQRCDVDGTFGGCSCGSSSSQGGSHSTGDEPGAVSDTPSASAGKASSGGATSDGLGIDLYATNATLIEVFVTDSAIFIVSSDSVRSLDRAGKVLAEHSALRPITSAAFDGELLVVADAAKLTTFDTGLKQLVSANLLEGCVSAVLLSDHRFVCGPENDWDRVFYTYDAKSGDLLATSKKYTYNGIPMSRVPGNDDFVCVTVDSSPSDFHLYTLDDHGESIFVNESPYHGDFRVTDVYAFDGFPATHLVTDTGLLLKIYGDKCSLAAGPFSSECFVKDGALGTLTGEQVFLGMDQDAQGQIYGLVTVGGASYFDPLCDGGCLLQQIDVATRTIVHQHSVAPSLSRVIALRHDPLGQGVIIGSRNAETDNDDAPGYRVQWYSFE